MDIYVVYMESGYYYERGFTIFLKAFTNEEKANEYMNTIGEKMIADYKEDYDYADVYITHVELEEDA